MTTAAKCWALLGALGLMACSSHDHGYDHGPFWTGAEVAPVFTVKQNSLSTSFSGWVFPQRQFVFGPADGVQFDKPNAQLTLNANSVWQYAPVIVELYDGPKERIGSTETLIVDWVIPAAPPGGELSAVRSRPLARAPVWAVVSFPDFSGNCILEVLGHD